MPIDIHCRILSHIGDKSLDMDTGLPLWNSKQGIDVMYSRLTAR